MSHNPTKHPTDGCSTPAGRGVRERLFALEAFGIKLGLDNMRTLAAALDHPERAFPTVHVAGTNGKGSVCAMVERALRAAGYDARQAGNDWLTADPWGTTLRVVADKD